MRAKTTASMSPLSRRLLGVGLALCALIGGTVLFSAQRARILDAARAQAQHDVDATLPKVVVGLDALSKDVAQKAERGARLEAIASLLSQITTDSDVAALAKTFEDFEGEPFFAPYASVGEHAFFLGQTPLYSSDASLTARLTPLAVTASTSGTANAYLAHAGSIWAVGVGRSEKTNPQQQPALLALAQKLNAAALEPIAAPLNVAVLLVPEGKVADAIAAGKDDAVATLKQRVNSMKLDDSACCARKQVFPGVELLVHRDSSAAMAAANADASQSAIGIFGIAGVIALVALVIGFRRPSSGRAAETQLLRETAEQLRQSQEQLQRLSQNLELKTTPHLGGPPPGLGSTQAAVQASRYEIVAPLGEGGMARVAVAVVRGAEGFRRTFVLKRLRPELANNQEIVNQFIDEARLGASLVHSNIVPVFDFGRDADGYYLAQEYILGRDVDALVTASKTQRGTPLELPFVLLIGQEALKALGYAHTRRNDAGKPMGLVHRDVSPNNLMVSARGEVKLLDFGIVKSADRVTQTQAGVVKGNLFFMSPEQARALETDPRSDLFSLGMVLLTALTGAPLYSGNNVYELMQLAAAGPTEADRERVRQSCGPLADVILRALSLDPNVRFTDAEDFGRALTAVGTAASTAELQTLMELLFANDFANERQKFAVTA
jgi:Protein kinase domain